MLKRFLVVGVMICASVVVGAAQGTPPIRGYIVVLKPGATREAAVQQARSLGGEVSTEYRHALNGFAAHLPEVAFAAIERNPAVLFVSPDEEVTAASACDLTVSQCLPTGIDRIDADRSSTRAGDGRGFVGGVNVAVLDTGISNHPDLNLAGGVDCTSAKSFDDPVGHGTHVAGTIGAIDDRKGVVGVAPGANLWSVRVLNKKGSGTLGTVLCGIDWVTGTRSDSNPANDIAVANMSLTGGGSDDGSCGQMNKDAMHLAICNSVAAGVFYAVAAGNSGQDIATVVPASYDEVLTVTAVADFDGRPGGFASPTCLQDDPLFDDTAAFFSDFATTPADAAHTIAAPGVCILSTVSPGSTLFPESGFYGTISGTSQASPHVAGTAALCIASGACAGMAPAQIIQKIRDDSAAYSTRSTSYGFQGDPLRPIAGKYYGYLIRAALY